jgi:hypothetical protein
MCNWLDGRWLWRGGAEVTSKDLVGACSIANKSVEGNLKRSVTSKYLVHPPRNALARQESKLVCS